MNFPSPPPPGPDPVPAQSWSGHHWALFVSAVLAPPVFTALAAMLDHRGPAAPALMFLGGAAGGFTAGVMLGCRLGKTPTAKVLLSLVLAAVTAVAVISLSGFGCALGNYKLDFR